MKYPLLALAAALAGAFSVPATAGVIAGSATPSGATLGAVTATQLVSSTTGTGHQLIAPYFSTQGGNATLLSLTNNDAANGKVVKVRFRGALNGDTLTDFMVLLAPLDTWTATVLAMTPDSPSEIFTMDNSCTVPAIGAYGSARVFSNQRVEGEDTSARNKQTREGYIEVINLADIPSATVYGAGGGSASALYTAVKHVNPQRTQGGVPPCTASAITPALSARNLTTEAEAAALGLAGPTGGLIGKWTILNVPQATTHSGDMAAVRAVDAQGRDARAAFVVFPQLDANYDGDIDGVTSDPMLRTRAYASLTSAGVASEPTSAPLLQATHSDLPDLSTPYLGAAADNQAPLAHIARLSAALAVRTLLSDFTNDHNIQGVTDWVHVLPTRRYSMTKAAHLQYGHRLFSPVAANAPAYFHSSNTGYWNNGGPCVLPAHSSWRDREGHNQVIPGAVFTGTPLALPFCGAVAVHSGGGMSEGPSAVHASVTRSGLPGSSGWGRNDWVREGTSHGMPILGFSLFKATNLNAAPGVLGTYGISTQSTLLK